MTHRPTRTLLTIAAAAVLAASVGACSTGTGSAVSGSGNSISRRSPSREQPSTGGAGETSALPHPAHVIVVVEENHAAREILGNRDAPFLNSLAVGGASLTDMSAIRHPSEPNYLALFSGSTQRLTDDSCPHGYPGANLATRLIAAHRTFAGYSEGLPRTGWPGCSSGDYARKHNPWSDFPAVPSTLNRPMTAFPADFATLAAVSFVIPDLAHDMHDGTVAQADTWLRAHLGVYARWATTHNSLLVVTWDEDDHSQGNRIPTIIAGAHVNPGRYGERSDTYRLLRTLTALADVEPMGAAVRRTPITDIWR